MPKAKRKSASRPSPLGGRQTGCSQKRFPTVLSPFRSTRLTRATSISTFDDFSTPASPEILMPSTSTNTSNPTADLARQFQLFTKKLDSRLDALESAVAAVSAPVPDSSPRLSPISPPSPMSIYSLPPQTRPLASTSSHLYSAQQTTVTPQVLPTTTDTTWAPRSTDHSAARSQIADLLLNTATGLHPPKGNLAFLPHKFILRGDFYKKIGPGEATWPEYFSAINRMTADQLCPPGWSIHLNTHLKQLATMANTWDWPTCRRWSERVFRNIAEGIFTAGWEDPLIIKDLQRDVCAVTRRPSFFESRQDTFRKQFSQSSSASTNTTQESSGSNQPHKDYDKARDGKPCYSWNWGRDCGFTASHGTAPELSPHICAWCAYRYHRWNPHTEKDCNNKKRFVEKKSAESQEKPGFQT